jgi:hypothetical protein
LIEIIAMKPLLLPNRLKNIGWILLLPSFVAGLVFIVFEYKLPMDPKVNVFGFFGEAILSSKLEQQFRVSSVDLIQNLIGICFLIGGILVMFSKEKKEDEFINQLRLNALQWSVFINYSLLLFCFLLVHGLAFLNVMVYNMFTIIVIYILRFQYLIYNHSIVKNEQ